MSFRTFLSKLIYPESGMFITTEPCNRCLIKRRVYFIGTWIQKTDSYETCGVFFCRGCLLELAMAIKNEESSA